MLFFSTCSLLSSLTFLLLLQLGPSATMKSVVGLLLMMMMRPSFSFQPRPHVQQQSRQPIYIASKPWWKVWSSESGDTSDITTSPAFLKKKSEVVAKELEDLGDELTELYATVKAEEEEWGPQRERLSTEFTFLQQRTFNESRDADINARVTVVKELLPIIDNFDRAKANLKPTSSAEEAIVDYYNGCFAKIDDLLQEFDVEAVPTVGSEFNYNLHEAIQQVPSEEFPEDTVCTEFQKGYKIGDKLIRPAVVAVSLGS